MGAGKIALALLLAMTTNFLRAQDVVDVHAHLLPTDYVDALRSHDALMDEGFPLPAWDAEAQLRWMDEAGVATAVLTLAAPQPYFGDAQECARVVRAANETAARLKREHPGRFLFCAALPLPDVEAALREAVYALDTLGADGIKLATNARGQYLGDPALDTLFALLHERKAVIILHPHRPEPVNRQVMAQTPLAMQEYLAETTRAVANLFTRNVLARYGGVKVVVPHCGAYLPLALPRMRSLGPVMEARGLVEPIDWEGNLAPLYFDLAGAHSPQAVRQLLQLTTPNHLLYGSDYPYAAPQALTQSLQRMEQYLAAEPDLAPLRKLILGQNARWLFGQTAQPAIEGGSDSLLVRMADIEVFPEHLDEYLEMAGEVERRSVEEEEGVICLFPMQHPDEPTKVRILEIYASPAAYQKHLTTAHFQKYKQGTLHMVKDLQLTTLRPLDAATMTQIFRKMW